MDNGIRSVLPVCLESRDERELGHFEVSFLERYVAVLDDAPADPYFEDIVGLTFALDPVSLQDAIDLLHAMGFEEAGDNGSYTFKASDFVLKLQPVTEKGRGVRNMTVRVRRNPEQTTYQLGTSMLVFGGDNLAHWTF